LFVRLFSVEECAARRECKVQPAIRGHYADGGEHQIYDASPGQFAPVIVHDSPLFPVLTFEGLCGGIRAARPISPQCGAAATPDPRSYRHRRRAYRKPLGAEAVGRQQSPASPQARACLERERRCHAAVGTALGVTFPPVTENPLVRYSRLSDDVLAAWRKRALRSFFGSAALR
jgi:hypothetical protein